MTNKNLDFSVIILAGGLGKRMGNSEIPKALTKTSQMSFVEHQFKIIEQLNSSFSEFGSITEIVIVTGHKRELLEAEVDSIKPKYKLPKIIFAHQKEQLGTGHAARVGIEALNKNSGCSLILYGDVPLITVNTLRQLTKKHYESKGELTFLTLITDKQTAYGRIIRDKVTSSVLRITELKDCSPEESLIKELNPGIYIGENSFLNRALKELKDNNAQKEFYLTDIVEDACKNNLKITTFSTIDSLEVQGVNNRIELALVNKELALRKTNELIESGVTFISPESFFITGNLKVGKNVKIGPNVQLFGEVELGDNVIIEGTAVIKDSKIGSDTFIKLGVRIEDSIVGNNCAVGPFAHLRPQSKLDNEVKIGNFVETKKAQIGRKTSVSHLTYLGDCQLGEEVNIGAGTITCNYDGFSKFETKIGDRVFVGSNTALVAPLTLGDDVTIGAGSTITKSVQNCELALTRAELKVKQNYIRKKKG